MSSIEAEHAKPALTSEEAGQPLLTNSRPRPRPRPVLSCLRCRSRKIKCDRLTPCNQCTLTGHDRQCSYNARPKSGKAEASQTLNGSISRQGPTNPSHANLENSSHQAPISLSIGSQGSLTAQTLVSIQQRLQQLEQVCSTRSHAPVKTSDHEADGEERDRPLAKVDADARLSIKTSGPRYHSQSYKKSLLHHFGVVGRFCISGFDDPERAPVMNELRMYHERYTKARKKSDKSKPASFTLSPILELLPSRAACDEAVSSYFTSFEKSLRILHCPSFMGEYQRFWDSGETQRQDFTSFVPQLAVILAIMWAWKDASFSGNEKDVKPDVLCGQVEAWLGSLKGRKQLTIATLRTRALLIVAQQARSVQADEVWKATGNLMRSAMMAGLHRDPKEFPDIHIFEGELRRRLWMTIVELDLGASLINGMPIMLHNGDFTCNPPSNLDDLDLFDGMAELPASKSLREMTDSVFQVVLAGSLALRLQAISASLTRTENIEACIQALEIYIHRLPSSLHLDEDTKDFGQNFGTILLYVYIRRVLSHLYRSSSSWSDYGPEATASGLQSSLSILSYEKFLHAETLGPDNSQRGRYWDLFHILCKSDIMQAALDVALHAQVQSLVSWTKASLLLAIDDTIASLMQRISRNGSDIKDVLRLEATSQLVKSQAMKADRESMMREGAYNVLMACRRAARQEETYSGVEGKGKDMQPPPSPNTQLALEQSTASIDWSIMPSNPSLANNDLASYLDAEGANFDFLPDFTLESIHGDLWNQY